MEEFSREQVAQHNTPDDCYVVIDNIVYNVTKFAGLHPGGAKLLLDYGGQDCTEDFYGLHRVEVLEKFGPRLQVGKIRGSQAEGPTGSSFGEISMVPYAEPAFWRGLYSPYYDESHITLRKELRRWMAENVREEADFGEDNGKPPSEELIRKIGSIGLFAASLGPGAHLDLVERPPWMPGPDKFDYFHELICHDEVARLMCPGFEDGIFAGMSISVPAMLQFGTDRMKKEIAPAVLRGEKRSCLAITEPFAGSDVASVRCSATKTPDGSFYIVNGVKKWITNGVYADYFVTLVRTGGKGAGG